MTETTCPLATSTLHYGSRPSRRKRFARKLRIILPLLVVATLSYWWAPPIRRRRELAYWYDQCLRHVPPAERIAWEKSEGPMGCVRSDAIYTPSALQTFYTMH